MSVSFFNPLPKGEYSKLLIVVAFSNTSFSGKTSLLVKNAYLLTFSDTKAEILAAFQSKSYRIIDCFNFLTNSHFYNRFFLNHNGFSHSEIVSFTKNKYGSLV